MMSLCKIYIIYIDNHAMHILTGLPQHPIVIKTLTNFI